MVGDSQKCKCIDCILSLEEVLHGRSQLEM